MDPSLSETDLQELSESGAKRTTKAPGKRAQIKHIIVGIGSGPRGCSTAPGPGNDLVPRQWSIGVVHRNSFLRAPMMDDAGEVQA
ncbi:hypothetical protein TgHK011_008900 [Trichoderma gracile]|nr:hypothetical protein TgHK011_008900 [Trichoderma gracile]